MAEPMAFTVAVTPWRVVLALLVAFALYASTRKREKWQDLLNELLALGAWALVALWLLAGWLL